MNLGLSNLFSPLEEDGKPDIKFYNAELERIGKMTWGNAPWLFSECYLYRKLQLILRKTENWKNYDIFARQKMDAFESSAKAVGEIAVRYKGLAEQLASEASSEQLELLFVCPFVSMSRIIQH